MGLKLKKVFQKLQVQMSLLKLPTEILYNMFHFLETNRETIALVTTCRSWNNLGKQNGYIRKMCMTPLKIGTNWISNFNAHNRCIDRVFVHLQDDPHFWIFRFPRIVNCYECHLSENFLPNGGRPCDTELLIFRTMNRKDRDTRFETDWSLFPKLKRLVLYVDSANIDGLEKLENLETLVIYTNEGKYIRDGKKGPIKFIPY